MNKDELARELGHPGAQKLLSGSIARLAYNGYDGFPRVIPVGFHWTGERIVVSTAPTSPKARALSSRPQVALTIDTGSTPEEAKAKALLVRGLATLDTVDGVTEEYLVSARNSMDGTELAEFEHNVRSTYPQMVRISIEPLWARFYDFGAGRLPRSSPTLSTMSRPAECSARRRTR
jgi:nitroimidazol reductase NimA-like FMN-containing flavoprotein (pyridoxamine 5'-phosphate oxidase superfamily)